MSVEVKKTQHKYVIGPRGAGLSEILEACGVSVEVPPLDRYIALYCLCLKYLLCLYEL